MADTSTVSLTSTLGELVAERPARARVFERHGVDYCCHGRRTLAEAATSAGIDPAALVSELEATTANVPTDVEELDPPALVEHILATHHAYLHEELPALRALADKVEGVHGGRHPELAKVADLVAALESDLEPHMAKEEQILFPAIARQVPGEGLAPPIRMMELEHEQTGALLAALEPRQTGTGCRPTHAPATRASTSGWPTSKRTRSVTSTSRTTCCSRGCWPPPEVQSAGHPVRQGWAASAATSVTTSKPSRWRSQSRLATCSSSLPS